MKFVISTLLALSLLVLAQNASAQAPKDVNVVNNPTVTVSNLPTTQAVEGTIEVSNGVANPASVVVQNGLLNPVQVEDVSSRDRRGFVLNPRHLRGFRSSPSAGTTHDLVSVVGSGVFLAAKVTIQGPSFATNVRLILDGEEVIAGNRAALSNTGLVESSLWGISLLESSTADAYSIVIGFPTPLIYKNSLILRAQLLSIETGIVQMSGAVVVGD